MGNALRSRLVPDSLWSLVAPLVPGFHRRPQGGGTSPRHDRDAFEAVVFVLTSNCAWRRLPPAFAVSPATAHRRFTAWTEAGLWEALRRVLAAGGAATEDREWAWAVVEQALARSGHRARAGAPDHPRRCTTSRRPRAY